MSIVFEILFKTFLVVVPSYSPHPEKSSVFPELALLVNEYPFARLTYGFL